MSTKDNLQNIFDDAYNNEQYNQSYRGDPFAEDSHHRLAALIHLMHIRKIVELVQHFKHMITGRNRVYLSTNLAWVGHKSVDKKFVAGDNYNLLGMGVNITLGSKSGICAGHDELLVQIFVDSSLWPKYLLGEMVSNYLHKSYGVVEKVKAQRIKIFQRR
ncbi:hypothetical protein L6452_30291 [Arctium lappa]|uniref:Uncharacterized protein n=1 Tax=Arctium lappa TaxID=4217 RepID=A0ACB8ZHQ2_ARCLA|nr:hypothetical protein L6452_30291 [Arctium lappa]